MELSVKTDSLRAAIAMVVKITGAEMGTLVASKKGVFICGSLNNKSARIRVEAEVTKLDKSANSFGFNCGSVMSLMKGRDTVELSLKENTVSFLSKTKSSKFKGEFQTTPPEDVQIAEEQNPTEISLPTKALAILNTQASHLYLQSLFPDPLTLCVLLNDTGLRMAVYDDHHMAFAHDPSVDSKTVVDFSIPVELFQIISSVTENIEYTLLVGYAYIVVKSEDIQLSLPIMQSSNSRTIAMAETLMQKIKDTNNVMQIERADLVEVAANMDAINDGNVPLKIESKKKGVVNMSVTSPFGSAKDSRKITSGPWKDSFALNPKLLNSVLSAYSGKTVRMNFNPDFVVLQHEQGSIQFTYLVSLM